MALTFKTSRVLEFPLGPLQAGHLGLVSASTWLERRNFLAWSTSLIASVFF